MNLTVLNSGSEGNGYILQNDAEALIIECGVRFKDCKVALGFNVKKVVGAIVTHSHLDHIGYVSEYIKSGIEVYSSDNTFKDVETVTGERTKTIRPLVKQKIGNFTVTPFNVPHDVECYGYLIEHPEIGKLLFLTDLEYCPYNFQKQKVNHILCECNYDKELVDRNYDYSLRNRVLQTHMSLQTFLGVIKTNKTDSLQNIILCHLSHSNSDSEHFIGETKKVVSCPVYVAEKGLQIELSAMDCPF